VTADNLDYITGAELELATVDGLIGKFGATIQDILFYELGR
jgi:hypothetical protein